MDGIALAPSPDLSLRSAESIHAHRVVALLKRLIQTGQNRIENRPVTPIGAQVYRLPDIFDIIRILSFEQGREVFVNRCRKRFITTYPSSTFNSIQTGLAAFDLHHAESDAIRVRMDDSDTRYLQRSHCASSYVISLRRGIADP